MPPRKDHAPEEYSIGQLSREFGVTARAIRFYEAHGLLAPRRDGQRRIYTPRDRTRLLLTLRGKRLGFSLAEIRDIVDLYDAAGGDERPQLERLLAMLQVHRNELLHQRADIESHLKEIDTYRQRVRRRLAGL